MDFNILQDRYEPALTLFLDTIEKKHREYGESYKDRAIYWMLGRLKGEENEYFNQAISLKDKAREAIDCGIIWFLIAQKHLLLEEGGT